MATFDILCDDVCLSQLEGPLWRGWQNHRGDSLIEKNSEKSGLQFGANGRLYP